MPAGRDDDTSAAMAWHQALARRFPELAPASLTTLAGQARRETPAAQATLLAAGDVWRHAFWVERGMLRHAEEISGLYRRHTQAWSAERERHAAHRLIEADWLERFRSLLPARPSVLDLGCGSGEPIAR